MLRSKRQQSDVAGLLDGAGQAALVRCTNAGKAARHDLAALGHEALQQANVAIGNRIDLLGAELADLLSTEELAAATGAAAAAETPNFSSSSFTSCEASSSVKP